MRLPQKETRTSRAPEGVAVYAIGDVHGRLDLLACATEEIEARAADTDAKTPIAVFLGDYIDRGPNSREVLDHLIALRERGPCELTFLRGNHEQVLLDLVAGKEDSARWLAYGGRETLQSYGVAPFRDAEPSPKELRDAALKAIPPSHLAFLEATELYRKLGGYIFVHAGLRPDRLLEEQSEADMLWYRQVTDEPGLWTETVVHGHSPTPRPVEGRSHVGIDTGAAFEGGALTLLRIDADTREFWRVSRPPNTPAAMMHRWDAVDVRYGPFGVGDPSVVLDSKAVGSGAEGGPKRWWRRVLGRTAR